MASLLWQFKQVDGNAVPNLVPAGGSPSIAQSFADVNTSPQVSDIAITPIDIANDFYWTQSKPVGADRTGRAEVPYIVLKERRVKTSSFVAQALYSAGSVFDTGKGVLNALGLGNFDTSSSTQIASVVQQKLTALQGTNTKENNPVPTDQDKSLTSTLMKNVNAAVAAAVDDPSFLHDPWLSWYKGLYITEPTGWMYFLPYMSNTYQTTNNAWGDTSGDAGGQMLVKGASKLIEGASEFVRNAATMLKIGSFQEKAKFYTYDKGGETISLSFPLINTGNATFNDVVRNWQFVFLLLWQNRAQRLDRNVVEPPPIYEVTIPGLRYMPLCYISDLKVEFKGARRTMTLPIPSTNGSGTVDLQTVVPEAYQISISITSLVGATKNFMYSTVYNSSNVVVATAKAPIKVPLNPATSAVNIAKPLQTNISSPALNQGTVPGATNNLFQDAQNIA